MKAQSDPNRQYDPRLFDPFYEKNDSEEAAASNEPVEQASPFADEKNTGDATQVEAPADSGQGPRRIAVIVSACVVLAAAIGALLYRKSSRA